MGINNVINKYLEDDIDVSMPREDYEIFKQKGPNVIGKDFFIQNYDSDPEFTGSFGKARNSNTTFIESFI